MTLGAGVALLVVVVLLVLAVRWLQRRTRAEVATMPGEAARPEPARLVPALPEPALPDPTVPEPEPETAITWTTVLTVTSLDEAGRLRLIDDLALLNAPWTVALLRRAYDEESSPQLLARIEAAFASAGEPIGATQSP